jgi:hypothetical protein
MRTCSATPREWLLSSLVFTSSPELREVGPLDSMPRGEWQRMPTFHHCAPENLGQVVRSVRRLRTEWGTGPESIHRIATQSVCGGWSLVGPGSAGPSSQRVTSPARARLRPRIATAHPATAREG